VRRLLTASAVFALAVLTTAATGQPPPGADVKPAAPDKKADKKPADPTDAAIAAALARDPDVLASRAKIQLAEAELAKARLAVTQKVLTARSVVQDAKMAVVVAEHGVEALLNLYKVENVPLDQGKNRAEYRLALAKVEAAKAKVALAEAELKLLTGGSPPTGGQSSAASLAALEALFAGVSTAEDKPERGAVLADALRYYAAFGQSHGKAAAGPIPDRIRAALDKPVKLGPKGEKVTFEKALEIFKKDAGLDVPVRGEDAFGSIVSHGEELPVGAWFQVFQDHYPAVLYVREYGLLLAPKQAAPPDAISVMEFWKQKPPAKDTKPEPAPAPKK
jgi:hypothetical protein